MDAAKRTRAKTKRNLAIFIFLVLASGWLGGGLDRYLGNASSESLGMLLWIITPLTAALLLRLFAGDGWKDFGLKPNFKGHWGWYLFSILVFPVVTLATVIVGAAIGWVSFSNSSYKTPVLFMQTFMAGLLIQFIKNIFEEALWRGYLTPKIYSLKLNDFVGHTLVGLVWGAWHIPFYLFFLDRAVLAKFTALDVAIYIPLAIWMMITWSFVYGEIRLLTGSFWPAVLMHMVEDMFVVLLVAEKYIVITPRMEWLISPMDGLLNSLVFILLGVWLNRVRKKNTLMKWIF